MSCDTTLREKGLKLTPQRRLILDVIHESAGHLTGEEILDRVQAKVSGVNKSTIYRTLELLEKLGCVFKSELGDSFVYHHAEDGHHHHIVCRECGQTIDCDENLFLPVEQALDEKCAFRVDLRHVVMSGLCQSCQSKSQL